MADIKEQVKPTFLLPPERFKPIIYINKIKNDPYTAESTLTPKGFKPKINVDVNEMFMRNSITFDRL